jgi:hypothetical protein
MFFRKSAIFDVFSIFARFWWHFWFLGHFPIILLSFYYHFPYYLFWVFFAYFLGIFWVFFAYFLGIFSNSFPDVLS